MAFNIDTFKANGLIHGGARPSTFDLIITPPPGLTSKGDRITVTAKATSIPSSSISPIEVPYFGRKVKLAGDREFDNWAVTVMNDEDYEVRAIFEKWSNEINKLISNRMGEGIWPLNYKSDAKIFHYGRNKEIIRVYNIIGLFPIDVGGMDLSWEATNTIQEFNVTFAYDYWVPDDSVGQGPLTSTTYSPLTADDGIGS